MLSAISDLLESYRSECKVASPGPLSVVLHLTRLAIETGLPLEADSLITDQDGQVKGLGKGTIQRILTDHGISRVLSKEAGRTSRGSMGRMRSYVSLLNALPQTDVETLKKIEQYWIERVKDFFNSDPFKLTRDRNISLSTCIASLLIQAEKRQKEGHGTMYVGAMMQHLVGAKLQLVLKDVAIEHHGFSVSDQSTSRTGDFFVGNAAIHVTATPSEGLLQKCTENLEMGIRPIIVTKGKGVFVAQSLAEQFEIQSRIDIYEIEQFVSLNLYENFSFRAANQEATIAGYLEIYNSIIEEHETAQNMKIELK